MRLTSVLATLLVFTTVVGLGAPAIAASQASPADRTNQASQSQQAEAYTGAHISFDTGNRSVVDYTVNGKTLIDSVAVQSKSKARRQGGLGSGVSLSAVTDLSGAPISITATTRTHATIGFGSGAEMQAHDNGRGVFVVRAGGQSQYVEIGLSSGSGADQAGEKRVVVTTDEGTQSVFLVVGDGQVTVNEEGNVTTELGENANLVYRQYKDQRDESDRNQEQFITNGTATAAVYVQQVDTEGTKQAADVVQFSQDTTVNVTEKSTGRVTMTVDRARTEGSVILCTVSEKVFESTENIRVLIDDQAAAEASTYAEVKQSIQGQDSTSRYLVRPSSSAGATADVVVGINHFSSRSVTMTSETATATATPTETAMDGGMDGDGDGATGGGVPGFGPLVTAIAVAVLAGALVARRRF